MDKPPPKKRTAAWIKPVAIIGVLAAAVAMVAPYLSASLTPTKVTPHLTHTISRGDLSVTVTENGTVESSNNKEIKCFVKGGSTVLWVIETGTIVEPGEVLVRLDTSTIEENITQQQIVVERAIANQIIAKSDVDVATTNIEEYVNGTFLEERATIEKDIFDAEEQLQKAELAFQSTVRLASKGLVRSLQLDGEKFSVDSARKALQLKKQQLETLDKYKRKKMMQELDSALAAAEARLAAEEASLKLEKDRLARDKEQLENCVIKAEAGGMVIFPSAAEWKESPDIEEGAVVREQQTLLMIPDVSKMQVKVGIHESKVDQLRVGMPATVQLQDLTLNGEVETIATITKPAGWWTGNMVKYDTIIKLEHRTGLKPGMSAVVDIVLATHEDVLKIPVAAILESDQGYVCWVQTSLGLQRRAIELGSSDDEFAVVNAGLAEGDEVVLNPLAFVDDAQQNALKPGNPSESEPQASGGPNSDPESNQGQEQPAAKKESNKQKESKKEEEPSGAKPTASVDEAGQGK